MALEESLISQGFWPLCGIDEAGRGPLAGPVVAAAVIMDRDHELRLVVKDSKQLSPSRRARIYEQLAESDRVRIGFSLVDAHAIDELNILNATLLAMRQAVLNLGIPVSHAIVDGNIAPDLPCPCTPVIKGDRCEPSISAASIVAKVLRDRYMERMEAVYPGYGFAQHKGYPTSSHYEAIRALGACPIHRRSFKGVC